MSLGRLNAPYGHRQVAPVEGKTANTPRLGPVSTSRQRIAELARQALGMAVAIAWLPGPAGTRRRVAKLSVEEPDAAEPARPDLWGARVSNDPGLPDPCSGQCCSGSGRSRSRQVDARRVQGRQLGKTRTQVRSGVYGMSWEPGPPARHTSARAAWRPQNLDDGAMKKILVGAAAFGCRRGPSGADKTEIPDKAGEVSAETLAVQCRPPQFGSRGFTIVFPLIAVAMLQDDHGGNA